MRVLLVAKTYLPRVGGRELYQHKVLAQFAPHEVVVVTPDREGDCAAFDADYPFELRRDGLIKNRWNDWYFCGRQTRMRWFAALGRVCLQEHVDVVLCETVLPDGLSGWLLKRTLGKPYVIHAMGHDLAMAMESEWSRARLASVLGSAAGVIAISGFMGQVLVEQGADPDKVHVVVPGVSSMFLDEDKGGAELVRGRYGLHDKKVIVTVSRLVARKGQDKVIEAMPAILRAVPNAVYLVVGDGPDRQRLQALAVALGVDRRVIFVGKVAYDEAPSFYSAADVFAMPNREMPGDFEGFGIVFLEANARGLPVIGGRSGGARHAVADGESGYLVDPYSGADVASGLIELLLDGELARRLGANGRRRVEAEFSWDHAAARVRSIIREAAVCSEPSVPRKVWRTAHTLLAPDYRIFAVGS